LDDKFISIAIKNLQDVLTRKGISPEALFTKYDFDDNDVLDYGEFSKALESVTGQKAPSTILNAIFSAIDRNADGTLDLQEIIAVFRGQDVGQTQELDADSLSLEGHSDDSYNGEYSKQKSLINGQKWFKNSKNRTQPRILYFYNANSGGSPSWSLDDREQDGSKDLYRGGWTRASEDASLPLGKRRWVGVGRITISISYATTEGEAAEAVEYLETSIQQDDQIKKLQIANNQAEVMKQIIADSESKKWVEDADLSGLEVLELIMENNKKPSDINELMLELNQVRNAVLKGANDGSLSIEEGRSIADSIFESKSSNLPSVFRTLARKSWIAQADATEAKLIASIGAAAGLSVAGVAVSKAVKSEGAKTEKIQNITELKENNSTDTEVKMPVDRLESISEIDTVESLRVTEKEKIPLNTLVSTPIKEIFNDFSNVRFSSEIKDLEDQHDRKIFSLNFKINEIQRTSGLGLDEKYRGGYTLIASHEDVDIEIKLPASVPFGYYSMDSEYHLKSSICGWNRIRNRLMMES
jgi:hypothetical protein|tara:strand:- start:1166 stop:2746 length:1581 start_codon:yes stop_codon:yes gene_type:complete